MEIKIAPSILSSNFGILNEEIDSLEAHAEWVHIDVMDGHFVPNITIGPVVAKHIDTPLFKDCHLMIENPEKYVEDFSKAGVDSITAHIEATDDPAALIKQIHDLGCKAALSVKPGTDVEVLEPYLDDLDMVLVMSVEPGFGGQSFMDVSLPKIKWLREKKPNLDIQVDGGINAETSKLAIEAGANILVSGSYIFKSEDRAAAIASLRH